MPADGHVTAAAQVAAMRAVADEAEVVYGMCTACGSVEVALNEATGTRDLSAIGEP